MQILTIIAVVAFALSLFVCGYCWRLREECHEISRECKEIARDARKGVT